MVILKETTVSGDYVSTLANKQFKISKSPEYRLVPSIDNPDEKKEKLIMTIQLLGEDNARDLEFYPNKTSQKIMAKAWGYDTDNWIGKIGDFEILRQKVRGETRSVLYVKV